MLQPLLCTRPPVSELRIRFSFPGVELLVYDTLVHGRAIGVVQGSSVRASSNLGALPGKPVSHWQRRKERSRRDKRVNPMASVQV